LLPRKTRVIYFETPANPNMEIFDICEVRKLIDDVNKARDEKNKIHIVIDNTFATQFCQPHLNTVLILSCIHNKRYRRVWDRYGRCCNWEEKISGYSTALRKDFGAVLNPKSAWSIL
jgi:O-acetylhomoserine/O-acetylserine sulfhydrylase-like pyridoxal-dependent enzyme